MAAELTHDWLSNVDRFRVIIHGQAAVGVTELRRRGVTPVLGIYTEDPEDLEETFLSGLCQDAAAVGVAIRHTDSKQHVHELAPDKLARLEGLPDPAGETLDWAETFNAMRNYLKLHGHTNLPAGYRSEREHDYTSSTTESLPLGRWLLGQRSARLAAMLSGLVDDPAVHGVICPPPLPIGLLARPDMAEIIPEAKDVDGVHPGALQALLPDLGIPDDLVLTAAGSAPNADPQTRSLASAVLILATVTVAKRQHPPTPMLT